MKNPTRLLLLACALAPAVLFFSGCSGGGRHPDPAPQPGAAGFNPGAIDAALHVRCKGQVLQRLANGRDLPLPGVTIRVMSGGVNVDTAVTDRNGAYHVNLRRGQHNAVRASRAGFDFDPPAVLATPRQPEVLSVIIGTQAGGGQPGQGRVTVRFSGNPGSNPMDHTTIEIRMLPDNRVMENIALAGRSEVSFQPQVGSDLLITPSGRGVLSWQPGSHRVRVTPDEQVLSFVWPDQIIRSPAAAPTPRPVVRPFPRPTPRPSLNPASPRPQPTPTPALRPIRFPIGQP